MEISSVLMSQCFTKVPLSMFLYIFGLDLNFEIVGYHGDCSRTFLVGDNHGIGSRTLKSVAEECLYQGIGACEPGALFMDIGQAIYRYTTYVL